jgi:hypothetical protein
VGRRGEEPSERGWRRAAGYQCVSSTIGYDQRCSTSLDTASKERTHCTGTAYAPVGIVETNSLCW